MIKYALACEQAHEFESWFPTSEAFEAQRDRGLVTCPYCNSAKVKKQLMAPSVARTKKNKNQGARIPSRSPWRPCPKRTATARHGPRPARQVMADAENVGKEFADEARRMSWAGADASLHLWRG